MGGILFPLSYSDCDEEVFGSLSWKDTFEKSKLSVIDYDEKHRLLDMLYKSISGCINDWRNTVNKVCDAKLVDSSVLIEDII